MANRPASAKQRTPAKKTPKRVSLAAVARSKAKTVARVKPTTGRPSKYDPAIHPMLAEVLASAGRTEVQIAEKLRVAPATIDNWKKEHPEFLGALRAGKAAPDDQVERSLYERATGYNFNSEKIVTVSDGQNRGSHIERVPIIEHCPPDVTAQIFWLKNRRPAQWRDRHELTGADGGPLEITTLTPDERAARLAEILARAQA